MYIPSISVLAFAAVTVLLAAVVRGYSGFGFSMITTLALSMVFTPAEVVPSVLLMEVAASAWLMPKVWKQVDWVSIKWLLIGVLVGTPAGVALLAAIPARPMRAAIAVAIIALIVLLWRGFALKTMPGRTMTLSTGIISGVLNGGAAIGGPPAILFYFSSPAGIAVSRASLIAYFFGTDIIATGVCTAHGLVSLKTVTLTGLLLLPLFLGVTVGSRFFARSDPKLFRRIVLLLLLFLALITLVRAAWGL